MIRLSSPRTHEFWEIPILWEDESLLAVDKPAGLLASPDRYDPERPNLMKLLHRDIDRGAPWAKERSLSYLANVHRLDFETSGVLLLARNRPTLIAMADLFGSEKPTHACLALAHGRPGEDRFEVDVPLAPDDRHPGRMRVDTKRGKKSITRFEVLEHFREFTLFRCEPITRRTHQIRIHLQYRGFPLVGDPAYGGHPLLLSQLKPRYRFKPGIPELPLIRRTALHAEQLQFSHPTTQAPVHLRSPLPKDFSVGLKYLRKFSLP